MDKVRIRSDRPTFTWVEASQCVPFDEVTAVVVAPFTACGDIVAVVLARGVDIPGGHVQHRDLTVEDVARREAKEEAAILLGEVFLTG